MVQENEANIQMVARQTSFLGEVIPGCLALIKKGASFILRSETHSDLINSPGLNKILDSFEYEHPFTHRPETYLTHYPIRHKVDEYSVLVFFNSFRITRNRAISPPRNTAKVAYLPRVQELLDERENLRSHAHCL